MDRRSWLWRRRSSEKSPGETESSGASVSSHSDDQVYSNQSFQSPEVTSKAEAGPEEVEALSEKLSEALLNISVKEELVKQHAKVAEEAVEGWEKAENEVFTLRQQVEVLKLRNSTLEDRVGHLDGALKECLRQLRQTREEKDQNVHEATQWQTTKSELESQIANLRLQLRSTKTEIVDLELRTRLKLAEEENSALKLEVSSMAEELEIRLIERELSNRAAEQASKLHLESVKKAARFEAECRRLTSSLRKASNEQRSFTDSQSDTCERISMGETIEFESSRTTPSVDMNLMDDFLEMERLAALPESGRSFGELATIKHLKAELEAAINRTSEAEEMLKKTETKNTKLTTALKEREAEVKTLRIRLEEAESKVAETEAQLASTNRARSTTEKELELTKETMKALRERVKREETEAVEVHRRLDMAESRVMATCTEKEAAESRCTALEAELKASRLTVGSLEALGAKCRELENEVSRLQSENQRPNTAKQIAELRIKQDTELAAAGSKFSECQKTIASLGRQLKALATLEDVLIG